MKVAILIAGPGNGGKSSVITCLTGISSIRKDNPHYLRDRTNNSWLCVYAVHYSPQEARICPQCYLSHPRSPFRKGINILTSKCNILSIRISTVVFISALQDPTNKNIQCALCKRIFNTNTAIPQYINSLINNSYDVRIAIIPGSNVNYWTSLASNMSLIIRNFSNLPSIRVGRKRRISDPFMIADAIRQSIWP